MGRPPCTLLPVAGARTLSNASLPKVPPWLSATLMVRYRAISQPQTPRCKNFSYRLTHRFEDAMTTTDIDLDSAIRNNAGDAQIVALLLADELVGNSHMTCTVRDIAEAYLTTGVVAGRAVLRQEAACLDGAFSLLGIDASMMDAYVHEMDTFLSEKTGVFASVSKQGCL